MASGNIATLAPANSVVTKRNRRDLVELCVGYALILVVIWTPRPWQKLSYFAAATFLVIILGLAHPGWKSMGLQPSETAGSLWLVGVALLVSAVAVVVARWMHTLHPPGGPLMFLERYSGYALGACVQQFLLQNFFLPRLLRLMRGSGSAAFVAAAMFSLAHLPNPILTAITFFWGLAACLFFLRYRNLYTLAIAHTFLGITVATTVPGPVIRNMRVGIGYLSYSSHHSHRRNH